MSFANNDDSTQHKLSKQMGFVYFGCALPIVISTVFFYGWIVGNFTLTNPSLGSPAMVFTTAVSIFCCAVAIFLQTRQQYTLTKIFAGTGFTLMALFIFQYVVHHSFSEEIGVFANSLFRTDQNFYLGRPSPFSAIAIACETLSVLLLLKSTRLPGLSTFLEIITVLSLILGFVGFTGYALKLDKHIALDGWSSMSIYASVCIMLMGIAVLILIWNNRPQSFSEISPYYAPFLLILAVVINVYTPLGIITGFAYMPFVLCALRYKNQKTSFLFVTISTILGIIGIYMASSILTELWIAVLNRGISIVSLWILAVLIYQIKGREAQILSTQHTLSAILDNTVDGLITIDEYGRIEKFNKACELIFGYEPADVIGKNIKMLMPIKYSENHDQYLKNYRSTGERKIIGLGREVEAQKKDGTVFPIDLSIAEVPLPGAKRVFSGIVRDITTRKKAEEEIMRSNMELERFAYIASHDLQEPLRMLSNFTQLLSEEYGDTADPQAKEYMGFITDAARRMQVMIGDLLEYSRIGYEDSGLEWVNCKSTIHLAVENLGELINQTGAKITVGEMPVIRANSTRFLRLTQNLIGNGIKYRTEGTIPKIEIEAENFQDIWRFSFRDNGIGIKKEYLQQIFVMFKRLHAKNEYQGTGIGLAICKKIVESMHGRIWVESDPGKGSIFYFTIPYETDKGASHVTARQAA